jgi:hypothetical protein
MIPGIGGRLRIEGGIIDVLVRLGCIAGAVY